ncbi:hypothetical protein F1880_005779 [Penicillium rolfsii]|nr:hypothetical protein F1880_005779 [Penicillium rolfsii]
MNGVIKTPLNNKTNPIKVPGLGKIPVNVLLSHDQFATGTNEWTSHILTAKELAMLDLINKITDRSNWNRSIFDQQVIAQWREDALSSSSLINDKTWDWCLLELQDKARQFDQDGRLVVFNTSSGVCKSDTAISYELGIKLSNSVDLLSHQAIPDNPDSPLANLVDPSLFPLVYGRTEVLVGGGPSGLDEEAWSSCETEDLVVPDVPQLLGEGSNWSTDGCQYTWSSKFQWLPCEVQFTGPPGSSDVRISSYINNLHPRNSECYDAIEAVISSSIEQWNEIVVRNKWRKEIGRFNGHCVHCPREPIRIRTYGVEWRAQFPEWAKKLPEHQDEKKLSAEEYGAMCAQVEAHLKEPESQDAVYWPWVRTQRIPEDWKSRWGLLRTALTKYANTFVFEHSDPGTAYSYEDWKAGRTGKAIVGPAHHDYVCRADYELSQFFGSNPWLLPYEWMYKPKGEDADDHHFYTVALQKEFREQGLQVIVRIHNIELDPRTPFYPREEWRTEGNSNERIIANAIYTLDSTNVSEPLTWVYDRFGAMDSDNDESDRDSDDSYRDLLLEHALWDLDYISRLFGYEDIQYSPAWQQLGEVKLRPGRLISFPNAFQHRMGPLELQDKTKPGRCRFLTLSLIDPNYRLCSTWNVPPQQPGLNHQSGPQSSRPMDLTEALQLRDELLKDHDQKDKGVFELGQTMSFSGFS